MAIGTSACSGQGPVGQAPAATVGGTTISRADLDAQLLLDQKLAKAQATQQGGSASSVSAEFLGAGASTVPATKSSAALTTLVQIAILRESLDAAGGTVTDADRTKARQTVTSNLQSQGADVAKVPKDVLDQRVEFQALQDALVAKVEVTDAQLQAAYQAAGDTLTNECISVIYVSDEAAAQAALARVQAGEDFGAVSAEVSIDDTLKQAKGAIGCASPSQVAQNLSPVVAAAEVNDPVGPIQDANQSGWLVAQVTKRTRSTLAEVKDQLTQQIQQQAFPKLIAGALGGVHVDPRYGTWDETSVSVQPPTAPTVPTTAGASSSSTSTTTAVPATGS